MQWHDWIGVVGSIASGAGAWLAMRAWKEAEKAAQAADRTQSLFRVQALSESCNEALSSAKVLRELARSRNWPVLHARAEDLRDWCHLTLKRYHLPSETRLSLEGTSDQLRFVMGEITDAESGASLGEESAQRLVGAINDACKRLSQIVGAAMKAVGNSHVKESGGGFQ